ncbi:MAG: DUF4012 domain-containing protein [Patescibacteria group bacterium]|jgi:hypothetical protein
MAKNYKNWEAFKPADKPSKFVIDLKPREEVKSPGLLNNIKGKFVRSGTGYKLPNWKFTLNTDWVKKIQSSKLRRLAVFSFIIFFFRLLAAGLRLVFFLSYAAGWLMVFFIKLSYNLVYYLISPAVSLSSWSFEKFARGTLFTFRNLPKIAKHGILFPFGLLRYLAGPIRRLPTYLFKEVKGRKLSSEKLACHNELPSRNEKIRDESTCQIKSYAPAQKKEKFQWKLLMPKFKRSSFRPAFSFLALIIILILPVKAFTFYQSMNLPAAKAKVLGVSIDAFGNMVSAGKALGGFKFNEAEDNFSKASENFLAAEAQIKGINDGFLVLAGLIPDENIKLASESKNILAAGQIASALGGSLSGAMDILFSAAGNNERKPIIDILREFTPKISEARDLAVQLDQVAGKINLNNIPDNQKDNFVKMSKAGKETAGMLQDVVELSGTMTKLLGGEEKKRYLLIFENNAEMRGSGGFLGSFAILDLDKGKIKKLEVPQGGGYDTKGALSKLVRAPEAMHILGPRWYFWDANWWPDWPASAKKLEWFYENSDGSTVDGVIALTPTVLEKLLKITGPIDLKSEYGVIIESDNFWTATQSITEDPEQRATGKPKKIIGDLMYKMMDELPKKISKDNFIELAQALESSLNEKQILTFFNDSQLQEEVKRYGWDAGISATAGDYLMVANANIGGQKTDKAIKETISHKAEIDKEGNIIDTLKIIRAHSGAPGEAFTGSRNVDWMRIYVPLGSELLEAYGFDPVDQSLYKESYVSLTDDADVLKGEGSGRTDPNSKTKIYNEFGKTVFANWSQVDPGETIEINIKYRLPFRIAEKENEKNWKEIVLAFFNPGQTSLYPYSLMVEKQPGSVNTYFNSILSLDPGFNVKWKYPENQPAENTGWSVGAKLDSDKYWGAILEKK